MIGHRHATKLTNKRPSRSNPTMAIYTYIPCQILWHFLPTLLVALFTLFSHVALFTLFVADFTLSEMCITFYLVCIRFYLVIFSKFWKICQFVWENWRVLFSLYYRRSPSFKKFRNSKNHSKSYLQQIHTIISS